MELSRIIEQLIASAPGTALVVGMFAKAIHELRKADVRHERRFARMERRLDRVCDATGAEVTGRHSVPPDEE